MADAPAGDWLQRFDLDQVHREVQSWFTPQALKALRDPGPDEITQIGLDWLAKTGKRWRPFLVVSLYMAFREKSALPVPEAVKRVALAVEAIHKGSLICDDIQDQDTHRYREHTVHQVHGVPVALTVGLYLIGKGYRLIAGAGTPEQRVRMLELATQGHCDLCLGQGRELLWTREPVPLTPAQVLEIFRWKTAPSFEVVFRLPAILADVDDATHKVLTAYSQILGTAYQVQDDLQDFDSEHEADDLTAGRLSIVLALAHERAQGAARELIAAAWRGKTRKANPKAVRKAIAATGAEEETRQLLARHKRSALDALRPLRSFSLKVLLARLTDKILPQV